MSARVGYPSNETTERADTRKDAPKYSDTGKYWHERATQASRWQKRHLMQFFKLSLDEYTATIDEALRIYLDSDGLLASAREGHMLFSTLRYGTARRYVGVVAAVLRARLSLATAVTAVPPDSPIIETASRAFVLLGVEKHRKQNPEPRALTPEDSEDDSLPSPVPHPRPKARRGPHSFTPVNLAISDSEDEEEEEEDESMSGSRDATLSADGTATGADEISSDVGPDTTANGVDVVFDPYETDADDLYDGSGNADATSRIPLRPTPKGIKLKLANNEAGAKPATHESGEKHCLSDAVPPTYDLTGYPSSPSSLPNSLSFHAIPHLSLHARADSPTSIDATPPASVPAGQYVPLRIQKTRSSTTSETASFHDPAPSRRVSGDAKRRTEDHQHPDHAAADAKRRKEDTDNHGKEDDKDNVVSAIAAMRETLEAARVLGPAHLTGLLDVLGFYRLRSDDASGMRFCMAVVRFEVEMFLAHGARDWRLYHGGE